VKEFYMKLAPYAFKRQFWHIPILQAKFDARGLRKQIENIVGNRLLETPDLLTGFAIISKRMDTGSPWIISNNPRAPYWDNGPKHIGNRYYPLANLIRASTAAPHFFDPEILAITRNEILPEAIAKPFDRSWAARALNALLERAGLKSPATVDPTLYGLFVDGAVSPHGNPSLALLHLATLKPFGICWPTGPDRLTIVSIGTGTYRPTLSFAELGFARFPKLAYRALSSLMRDSETLTLALMQWMGECLTPWPINSEIGTLCEDTPQGGKLFRFLRYDAKLEDNWLSRELGKLISRAKVMRYRTMDDPAIAKELYAIGCVLAERQVMPAHWPTGD
jgi:hypothetical protein